MILGAKTGTAQIHDGQGSILHWKMDWTLVSETIFWNPLDIYHFFVESNDTFNHKIRIFWDWFCTACHIVSAAMNPLNSTSLDLARLRCYLKDGYQKPEKIVHFFHNALKIRSDSRFRTKLKSSINLSKTKRLSNKDPFFYNSLE